MIETYKYDFSFTAASLRLPDMVLVADALLHGRTIDYTNELGNGKAATGKRMLNEYQNRLGKLSQPLLEILVNGDLNSQKQIAFVAICKKSLFIRDFTIEVLREKFLLFDYQITESDYLSFFRRKFDLHLEMETLTDLTQKKIKQVLFKILEQVGLINNIKDKIIQPVLIEQNVKMAIAYDNPNWIKVLLMSDLDIKDIV
jgi:hypothetical protein